MNERYNRYSKAIVSRWAFPLAPDENMPNDSDRYESRRGKVYLGKDVDLSRFVLRSPLGSITDATNRTSTIAASTVVGRSCTVGQSSYVTHSILSPNTTIGSSCTITNSYLFEGARIGDNCVIRDSIIGELAVIGEGSTIENGSLVGARTKIGTGAMFSGVRVGGEKPEVEGEPEGATRESWSCPRGELF